MLERWWQLRRINLTAGQILQTGQNQHVTMIHLAVPYKHRLSPIQEKNDDNLHVDRFFWSHTLLHQFLFVFVDYKGGLYKCFIYITRLHQKLVLKLTSWVRFRLERYRRTFARSKYVWATSPSRTFHSFSGFEQSNHLEYTRRKWDAYTERACALNDFR